MGKKKEARIARNLEKQLLADEKKARLIERVEAAHQPRKAHDISSEKSPRAEQDPSSIMQMRMEYRIFDYADREGEWSWGEVRNWCDKTAYGPENACEIRSTMIEMSALYWHEIQAQTTGGKSRHKKHHEQDLSSLCNEAQLRWIEIEREEDELFRFRTGGKQRIWGFRTGHVFNVVWWDAEHQIYPVD